MQSLAGLVVSLMPLLLKIDDKDVGVIQAACLKSMDAVPVTVSNNLSYCAAFILLKAIEDAQACEE